MKQYRITLLIIFVVAFLSVAEAYAQTVADGQPSLLQEDKGQSNYVYDLKLLIKKSKDNIKTVNEKIKEQAILKRNQQREEKAREYYQQGLKLQEEGRLEEARQLFDKAIRITEHPEMTYYIKESERRSKLQAAALEHQENDEERRLTDDQRMLLERAETSYASAVSLYKQQKFHEAKDEFQLVEEMVPDYKAVRSYLQIVEQDIIQSDQLNIKQQKKEVEVQQREAEIARLREKELWRKEIDKKEQERQDQLRKQAQGVYDEAIKLYGDHKYLAAREKFQQVEWVVPDFKATRAYLTRIENDVQDEKKQITIERQRELEKQRWEDVLKEKKAEEDRRKALELREQERLAQVKDQAEFVYQAAVVLFEKNLSAQAKDKFDEVEGIYPNYKSTRDYVKRIDEFSKQAIEREALKKKTEEERRIWEEEMARRKEEKERFKKLTSEADAAYEDAMRLYQTGRLIEAKEKLLEVDQRVPDYKSTRTQLKRIDDDIELLVKTQKTQESLAVQREELEKMRAMRDQAEVVYAHALAAYDARDFKAAKVKFREVESIFSDYKKTKAYLNRIDEDIRQYEEVLLRASREKEADISYIQAMALYQAGQYEEAKKKFVDVESLVPDYKQTSDYLERIDDDIMRKKEADLARMKEEQVKGLYNQAMALYHNGEYAQAKDSFLQVEVIYPGYKETTRILGVIDIQIDKQKKDALDRHRAEQAEQVYIQAVALYQTNEFVEAKEKFVKVEVIYADYKDTLKYLARIDGDIARKKREDDVRARSQQAEPLYTQAVDLYKELNFPDAKNKFIQVQAVYPGYKETSIYLSRIDKDMADLEARLVKQDKARKSDAFYSEAVKFYVNRQFPDAKIKFLELAAVDPDYKNVRMYLSRIDADIIEETLRQKRNLAEQQAAEPYAQAVTLYHDGDLQAAKSKFLEVVKIVPDYQKARMYLARVDQDMHTKRLAQEKERLDKADAIYKEAAAFMAAGKIVDAFKKFNDVEAVYPDYKAVHSNLEKLRKMAVDKGLDLINPPVPVANATDSTGELTNLYKQAVQFYKDKRYDESLVKFEAVNKVRAGYRSTQKYLDSIKEIKSAPLKEVVPVVKEPLKAAPVVAPAPLKITVPVVAPVVKSPAAVAAHPDLVSAEAPVSRISVPVRDDAKALKALSMRSSVIYKQIKALSEEKQVSNVARTFAKVDRLIDDLERERERVAQEVARQKKAEVEAVARAKEQEKDAVQRKAREAFEQAAVQKRMAKDKALEAVEARQAEMAQKQGEVRQKERAELDRFKDEQREAQLKAEVVYQQALAAFRVKDYQTAYDRFVDVQKLVPDYKDSTGYLTKTERIQGQVVVEREEAADRDKISRAAEKAAALNIEILELSQKKEYEAVEKRFNDLEAILKDIQGIKAVMVQRRAEFESAWQNKALARKAGGVARTLVKSNRSIELEGTPRERAVALFREGQQFYAAGQYPEARVKFVDAVQVDPTYQASMSFVNRIDRILAKKDFEVGTQQAKMRSRDLARKEKGSSEPLSSSYEKTADPVRAAKVSQEGTALYKARRYREARIKFEELFKVGNDADERYAQRYFVLIEQALNKEKLKQQQEQHAQEERFIQERRSQVKMEWERGKLEQKRRQRVIQQLSGSEQDREIQREQQIRTTEEENARQRRGNLEKKAAGDAQVDQKDRRERDKYIHEARQQQLPVDVKAAENREARSQAMADNASAVKLVVTDTQAESAAKAKENLVATSRKERRRLDQLESNEQRSRRLKEEQDRRRMDKEEQIKRRAAEKWAEQKKAENETGMLARRIEKEKEKFKKDTDTDVFIRRNQEAVEAILKEDPQVLQPVAVPVAPSAAVVEQKRLLDGQRAAIRKDFEDGVERLYAGAVEFYKKKLYDDAKADFIQVDGLIKGYKKTAQYLKDIDRVMLKPASPKELPRPVVRKPEAVMPPAPSSVPLDRERSRVVADVLNTFDVNAKQ